MIRHPMLERLAIAVALTGPALPAAADGWTGADKGLHLGASYSFGALGRSIGADMLPIENKVLRATLFGLMPGMMKELADSRSFANRFSGRDMAANLAGAIAGATLGDSVFVVPTGVGDGRGTGLIVGIHGRF